MHENLSADNGLAQRLAGYIRDVPDYPRPGVLFKDITPLLAAPEPFTELVQALATMCLRRQATKIAGLEARGFLLAAPAAVRAQLGFAPVRKAGKLPGKTASRSYELEYGTAEIEIQQDAFGPGDRVVVVDDVLATGGTAQAAAELIADTGATVTGIVVLLELSFLQGRDLLKRTLETVPLDAVITI